VNDFFTFLKMCYYNSVYKSWIELFGKHDKRSLKYDISLCLIFKNEAPFLKEWIDYHKTIGIDHFYLYNNNSNDNYEEVLTPFVNEGLVTLIDFPYNHAQFRAYKDCYFRFRNESKWISFLDADEFICPRYASNINDWIKSYDKYPAVTIQWLMFCTGGVLEHDYNKNVIEQYFSSWDHFHSHGKCIINTRYDIANFDTWHVHHHTYMYYSIFGIKCVVPAVNQWFRICTVDKIWGGGKDKLKKSSIQINHYFTKAWSSWSEKMHRTDVLFEKNPKSEYSYFYKYEEKCISQNSQIKRFLIRMKINQGLIQ